MFIVTEFIYFCTYCQSETVLFCCFFEESLRRGWKDLISETFHPMYFDGHTYYLVLITFIPRNSCHIRRPKGFRNIAVESNTFFFDVNHLVLHLRALNFLTIGDMVKNPWGKTTNLWLWFSVVIGFQARWKICEKGLPFSLCLSVVFVHPSAPTGLIFIKFNIWVFCENLSRKF
jgi:hypothetical protein